MVMIPLYLFNTLSRKKEEFVPITPGQVGLYTCGPTVYSSPHIGNLRTYIFEDILKRVLYYNGYKTTHVMNITDVGHLTSDGDEGEDKMEKGAKALGRTVWDLADQYTKEFKDNMHSLNILEPDIWCKATDHIAEQIDFIKQLETKGYTYTTSDGVYFDTAKFPHYGELAKLNLSGQKAGARVENNPEKKNPTDFALWKLSPTNTKRQMEWASPWGTGFPGWHIECSAMSHKFLGSHFDIHCGGVDHIPVHHTNEIAQSDCYNGHKTVNYWLHGEFLVVDEKRMGKSEGNYTTLNSLITEGINPLAYRLYTYSAHYRSLLNMSTEGLMASQKTLDNIYSLISLLGNKPGECLTNYLVEFVKAINDDLNIPKALAIFWETLRSDTPPGDRLATILEMDKILALGLDKIKPLIVPDNIKQLITEREQARLNKDWTKADDLRRKISEAGFAVDDTPEGTIIKK